MAKSVRGLPTEFSLDIPREQPVAIGDWLDEPPPPVPPRREMSAKPEPVPTEERVFRPEIVPDRRREEEPPLSRKVKHGAASVIRYQLNLSPKARDMFEDVIEHVRTYSPEPNVSASEVLQGIIGVLHNAMSELDLSTLPRRGAWGSVTARNFPGALGEAFEQAIVTASQRTRR